MAEKARGGKFLLVLPYYKKIFRPDSGKVWFLIRVFIDF
jgi:hypothetical protein